MRGRKSKGPIEKPKAWREGQPMEAEKHVNILKMAKGMARAKGMAKAKAKGMAKAKGKRENIK